MPDRGPLRLRRRAPQGRGARQRRRRLRHEALRHGRARGAAPGGAAPCGRPAGEWSRAVQPRSGSATWTSTWSTTWRRWRESPLQLTAKEFELLAYLARHAGKVCTHHMILKDVWGPGYGAESNYVRVYTHRLRKKMGDDEGRMLRTVPGIGYQLVADAHSVRGERVERVEHESTLDEAGVPLAIDAGAGDDARGPVRPMKRRMRRRSRRSARRRCGPRAARTRPPRSTSPHDRGPLRGASAAMAVATHALSLASASLSCSTSMYEVPRKPSSAPASG